MHILLPDSERILSSGRTEGAVPIAVLLADAMRSLLEDGVCLHKIVAHEILQNALYILKYVDLLIYL